MQTRHKVGHWIALSGLIALLSPGAQGSAVSGNADLICTSEDIVACADGQCMQGGAETFGMPHFMLIDVDEKTVSAIDEDGSIVTSPVQSAEVTEQSVVLQGIENHRGWTLGIKREDGGLTMSATGPDVSFIVFGNCSERQGGDSNEAQ
mgnify:CR=1 FL=1